MRIAVGADHGGYVAKEKLKQYLKELGHEYVDFGTNSTERCDYTDFAYLVAASVANKRCDVGIIIDAVGTGSCMMANKVPGVRAAVCNEIYTARNSRLHNGANVLTMGSLIVGDGVMKEIVDVWLKTELSGDRNILRVGKIMDVERRMLEGSLK